MPCIMMSEGVESPLAIAVPKINTKEITSTQNGETYIQTSKFYSARTPLVDNPTILPLLPLGQQFSSTALETHSKN